MVLGDGDVMHVPGVDLIDVADLERAAGWGSAVGYGHYFVANTKGPLPGNQRLGVVTSNEPIIR